MKGLRIYVLPLQWVFWPVWEPSWGQRQINLGPVVILWRTGE